MDTLQQDDDLLGQALLELASTDESELAYSLLERPDSRAAALVDARAHADPNQLYAVALLCYATANDAAQRATAAMHLAISLAIAEQVEDAVAIARDIHQAQPDTSPLVTDLADAITHRPQHAASLATLIRALQAEAESHD